MAPPSKTTKKTKTTKTTKTAKRSSDENENKKRSFKMLDESGNSRGRYTGSGPKQAASKAYSKYVQGLSSAEKKKIKGGSVATKIYVKESTRGGRKKIFGYEVRRVALDDPHTSQVTNKEGEVKEIVYKHRNVVRRYAIPENVLAKLSQDGGARKKTEKRSSKKTSAKSKSTTKAPAKKASGSKTAAKKGATKKPAKKASRNA
jgi:hypothetical protein